MMPNNEADVAEDISLLALDLLTPRDLDWYSRDHRREHLYPLMKAIDAAQDTACADAARAAAFVALRYGEAGVAIADAILYELLASNGRL
jgi:phage baseplate assembly protein W